MATPFTIKSAVRKLVAGGVIICIIGVFFMFFPTTSSYADFLWHTIVGMADFGLGISNFIIAAYAKARLHDEAVPFFQA